MRIFVQKGSVNAKLVYIYPTTKNIGKGIVMIMSQFCDSSSEVKDVSKQEKVVLRKKKQISERNVCHIEKFH